MIDIRFAREEGILITKIFKSGNFEDDILVSFYPEGDSRSVRYATLGLCSFSAC